MIVRLSASPAVGEVDGGGQAEAGGAGGLTVKLPELPVTLPCVAVSVVTALALKEA